MSEYDFDVLYLGSGHGAFDGAGPLAASGKSWRDRKRHDWRHLP